MGGRAIALMLVVAGVSTTCVVHAQPVGASNPALSLFPKGTSVDWSYWHAELGRKSLAHPRTRNSVVRSWPEVTEAEPALQRHWNDTRVLAEHLDSFGYAHHAKLRVRGALADSVTLHLGEIRESLAEDDGAIPLAREILLSPGNRVRLNAVIGDGPHGSEGYSTGDYDFYHIGTIDAGERVTAQIKTDPASTPRLNTKVGLYNASGALLFSNGDGIVGDPDSFLEVRIPLTGDYWVLVRGGDSDWPPDPFDSASGPKAGSEGTYTLTLSLESQDIDYYSFDLEAGDIFSAGVDGEVRYLRLYDGGDTLRMGSYLNWSILAPPSTPLYTGGNTNVAAVATAAGRYAIALSSGAGDYRLHLSVLRSPLANTLRSQILFVDFDGAQLDASHLGGSAHAQLSSLRAMLEVYQLEGLEEEIIDVVLATIRENLVDDLQTARNPMFHLELYNSRDHPEMWGNPNVSRIIVGGSQQELGLNTMAVADAIDVGNFALEETAVVLLDVLANPSDPASPSSVPYAPSVTLAQLIGTAIGTVAAHEAGHLFASFHTGRAGHPVDLMNHGMDPTVLLGIGPDAIFGTADDEDIDLGAVSFSEWEPFSGVQDSRNAVAYGLHGSAPTAIAPEPATVGRGVSIMDVWPNPVTTRVHVRLHAPVDTAMRLVLYDVLGRSVRAKAYSVAAGESRVMMPVDGLPGGVFLLRAEGVPGADARPVLVVR